MQKLIVFTLKGCPYCRKAMDAVNELRSENPAFTSVEIEWIDEEQHPEIARRYQYYYVPSVFHNGKKLFECKPGDQYGKIKQEMENALKAGTEESCQSSSTERSPGIIS